MPQLDAPTQPIQGHIVALGGGGFGTEPDNPLLDDFILSLAPRSPARVCFVPTASADSASYLVRFYRAFSGRAVPTDLTIFHPASVPRQPAHSSELASFVSEQDIIYVGGGNTANLLAIWRAHGLDRIFRDAWVRGAILCGVSAGMICWFRDSLTDSFGKLAPLGDGLGFIDATACPHYDGEEHRRPSYLDQVGSGALPAGYAVDDGCALHFRDGELVEAVSSRPGARAFRVHRAGGGLDAVDGMQAPTVAESPIDVRYLG